ncbi:MAG TPA: hypothetical protein VF043_02905 [Ktedonobacteraceae bacterium]
MLSTRTQGEHGKNLREGIDGQPEPQSLLGAAQPRAQFVQLQVWEVKMAEEALVQGLRVLAYMSEPGRDGGLSKAEDTLSGGRIEPFSQCRQDHGDLLGRGFQTIQRGVATGA